MPVRHSVRRSPRLPAPRLRRRVHLGRPGEATPPPSKCRRKHPLTTIGSVTAGTPYSSGQQVTVTVAANSTMSAANLHTAGLPGCNSATDCSGNYYVEKCTDPGGDAAQLPTTSAGCEATTLNAFSARNLDGSGTLAGTRAFTIYDLPDTNLGPPTMTGTCDVSPDQCVLGIFAANPGSQNGFAYPHLFSAPSNVGTGDGLDQGDDPGDGTPEVPLAIGLPLAAMAVIGGLTIRHRRRQQRAA